MNRIDPDGRMEVEGTEVDNYEGDGYKGGGRYDHDERDERRERRREKNEREKRELAQKVASGEYRQIPYFLKYQYGNNIFLNSIGLLSNACANTFNGLIGIGNAALYDAQYLLENGLIDYSKYALKGTLEFVPNMAGGIADIAQNEFNYITKTPIKQQAVDLLRAETWEAPLTLAVDAVLAKSTLALKTKKIVNTIENPGVAPKKKVGSYEVEFESEKKYFGKGPEKRMNASEKRLLEENPTDKVVNKDWKPSKNNKEAFKDEYKRMLDNNVTDPKSDQSVYNRIQSPGKKYMEQDGF